MRYYVTEIPPDIYFLIGKRNEESYGMAGSIERFEGFVSALEADLRRHLEELVAHLMAGKRWQGIK